MNSEGNLKHYQRMQLVEKRYEMENRLMELVRKGHTQKVQQALGSFSQSALERRIDPTRDAKNYSIILNTLMRKAAEQGGVHPMYIDRLSSEYALRIERIAYWDGFMALWSDMALGYCQLVRKHTAKKRSPLVQKIITRIDFDLTADLSLRANAQALNVNASYLSTLFKQETGETLTNYVCRKRMEHAAYLLESTQMPVSAVAQSCGISDDNYFTKLFKRAKGMTPMQFRLAQQQLQR